MSAGVCLVVLFVDTVGEFTNTGFFVEDFTLILFRYIAATATESKPTLAWHSGPEINQILSYFTRAL